jgi:hypothetical protein
VAAAPAPGPAATANKPRWQAAAPPAAAPPAAKPAAPAPKKAAVDLGI